MTGMLDGKVAIVTGGSQGVGRGIATALCEEGASVLITGRTEATLVSTTAAIVRETGGHIAWLQADVGSREAAERTVAHAITSFGGLDILINNAIVAQVGIPLETVTDEQVGAVLESGLLGTLRHMQAAFRPLVERGGGSIVNIGSNAGVAAHRGMAAYAAAKEGIKGLSRVAAREWGSYNIRTNVVCPAANTAAAQRFATEHPEQAAQTLAGIPLGRLGDPLADIGRTVAFLVGPSAAYVTGQVWSLNGGQVMA